jgi:hypothetical protein
MKLSQFLGSHLCQDEKLQDALQSFHMNLSIENQALVNSGLKHTHQKLSMQSLRLLEIS